MRTSSRLASVMLALVAGVAVTPPAHATFALIFGGTGALSYAPATALGGSAALAKDPVTGRILAGGAVVIGIADPTAATFYNGTIVNHYDSSLMTLSATGWLGSWGSNPALPAPPVDRTTWDSNTLLNLQGPNAGLNTITINNPAAGTVTTSFDWGPAGHADVDTAFNFHAALFTLNQPVVFTDLGNAPNAQPPAGANFYISTPGVFCSLPDEAVIQSCGEPTTTYFRVTGVPEPSSMLLLAGGLAALAVVRRRKKAAAT